MTDILLGTIGGVIYSGFISCVVLSLGMSTKLLLAQGWAFWLLSNVSYHFLVGYQANHSLALALTLAISRCVVDTRPRVVRHLDAAADVHREHQGRRRGIGQRHKGLEHPDLGCAAFENIGQCYETFCAVSLVFLSSISSNDESSHDISAVFWQFFETFQISSKKFL